MSPEEVRALPVTVPWWPTAAGALGYGQHSAYQAAKDGTAPVQVLRRGRRLVVTRAALLAALGIDESTPAPSAVPSTRGALITRARYRGRPQAVA